MKSWVTIALVLGLCGCRPSDQKVVTDSNQKADTVRDLVLAGEFVEFKQTGYSLCGPNAWTSMRFGDEEERMRVIAGRQTAFIQPGFSVCYRVGDEIGTEVNKKGALGGGKIRIVSVGLVLLDKLYGKNAEKVSGRYFQATDNLDKYKGALKSRMYPEMDGVVTVVNFVYLPGTAADEAAMKQLDEELSEGDGYKEAQEGKSIGKCDHWTDFDVNPEVLPQIKSGELRSWYRLGNQNCLIQGSEVGLRLDRDLKSPQVARVKVTKVKMFRVRYMEPKFFELHGFPYEQLKTMILKDNESKKNEFMTVTDFEYLGEVAP